MVKWDEQGAPNNNLSPKTIRTSKLLGKGKADEEFSIEHYEGQKANDPANKNR
ncbi:hypothetical protein [Neobacillus notoginsengisoli]|uniref:hypothetical protein n=1 Tax=Neobacillus notoginsengisoli TaxID=1578198 RepID=UPI001314F847|nr:hypothetical protein [Neobacillus notoginsengisoli]